MLCPQMSIIPLRGKEEGHLVLRSVFFGFQFYASKFSKADSDLILESSSNNTKWRDVHSNSLPQSLVRGWGTKRLNRQQSPEELAKGGRGGEALENEVSSQRAVKCGTRLASPIPWRGHGGGAVLHPPSKKGRADAALDESLHIRSDSYCQGQCRASDQS